MAPRSRKAARRRDPLIALINVVFLLLIFVMLAGTVAMPLSGDLRLVDADDLPARPPPDAALILEDGTLLFRGATVAARDYAASRIAEGETGVRIVPDRDLPAARLVEVAAQLRAAGAAEVWIVTERAMR